MVATCPPRARTAHVRARRTETTSAFELKPGSGYRNQFVFTHLVFGVQHHPALIGHFQLRAGCWHLAVAPTHAQLMRIAPLHNHRIMCHIARRRDRQCMPSAARSSNARRRGTRTRHEVQIRRPDAPPPFSQSARWWPSCSTTESCCAPSCSGSHQTRAQDTPIENHLARCAEWAPTKGVKRALSSHPPDGRPLSRWLDRLRTRRHPKPATN